MEREEEEKVEECFTDGISGETLKTLIDNNELKDLKEMLDDKMLETYCIYVPDAEPSWDNYASRTEIFTPIGYAIYASRH